MRTKTSQEKIRIVVTDSGLGGLSFSAELAERLKSTGCFREVEMIFFNCCPAEGRGYQTLENNEQRSRIFSRALFAIDEKFSPDVIVIACNTLSAIYNDTAFSENARIPVIGIIEPGTQCVSELFRRTPELNVLMFATPTTVSAGVHKQILAAEFAPERLLYQECRDLPKAIDYGDKTAIEEDIEYFMDRAVRQLGNKSFAIALFCTHFAYVRASFERAARRYANFNGEIIDPNSALIDLFMGYCQSGRFGSAGMSIKVVSQARQSEQMQNSIIPFLEDIFPETVSALRNYLYLPGLFDCSI